LGVKNFFETASRFAAGRREAAPKDRHLRLVAVGHILRWNAQVSPGEHGRLFFYG
jgi:hypothetical protein